MAGVETWSAAERRELLDRAVATYVSHGYSVRSQRGFTAVVAKRQQVNLLLTLALAIVTGGLWLVVLAIRLLNWPLDTVTLTVDEHGTLVPTFVS